MTPRLKKLYRFIEEIDKLKTIERRVEIVGTKRNESDAEHMWHLALMIILFSKDFGFKFDILKTLKMVLIHDLPEIYAGDTFLFDEEGRKTQKEREAKAAKKLFKMLPPDFRKEFHKLFDEFNAAKTPEARAAKIVDSIHPGIQHLLAGGKTWIEHKITVEQAKKAKAKEIELMKGTPMHGIVMGILKEAKKKGYMG